MKKLALLLCVFILLSCVSCKNPEEEIIRVSMIQLIANPEKYDGKLVFVKGVGNLQYEGDAVYLNIDDYINGNTLNGLWITLDEDVISYEEAKKYNGKYVIIIGEFDKDFKGHFGSWSGSINHITRYDAIKEEPVVTGRSSIFP